MTDRAHHQGRRRWMKQAAVLAGAVAAEMHVADTPIEAAPLVADEGTRVLTSDKTIVDTTAGKVRGFSRNGVHIFRGIPYGDTTAGDNRFLPPQKPKPWTGVRSSTSWGPVCPSAVRSGWRNDEEQFLYQWDDGYPGEDMLRINVWTPAVNDGRRRPVLVWIHGGGFVSGSSQELRPYDGERLAKLHDAVLVSMNHRLNVFGFLDLSRDRRRAVRELGQRRHARPRARAAMGSRQHRRIRRRSGQRHDLRSVGRRPESQHAARHAPGEGALPQSGRAERVASAADPAGHVDTPRQQACSTSWDYTRPISRRFTRCRRISC